MISDELINADVDIVTAAVEASRLHTATLIGDTDLLVLPLYYASETLWLFFSNQTEPNLMAVLNCMTSTV